jgi:hypothetical protein
MEVENFFKLPRQKLVGPVAARTAQVNVNLQEIYAYLSITPSASNAPPSNILHLPIVKNI